MFREMINGIIEETAGTVPTLLLLPVPAPSQRQNLPGEINTECGSNFEIPVVYYRQFISGVDGRTAKDSDSMT